MASCARSESATGRTASSVPCINSVGQCTRSSKSASGVRQRASSTVWIRISGVVSRAHATPSSRAFVECGSVKTWLQKNSANSR
jgi:hypothetical protein